MRVYTASAMVVLSAIMLTLVACGGEGSPPPDIDATVEARVQAEFATEATVEARVKDELVKAIPAPTPVPTDSWSAPSPLADME